MRYIIRTSDAGTPRGSPDIEARKKEVKKKILESGLQYLEYEAQLGSYDPLGQRIEERVIIIEEAGGSHYV